MDDSTTKAGKEAYDQTLAPYHSWFVRSAATVAMYALPTKEVLLNRVSSMPIDPLNYVSMSLLRTKEYVTNYAFINR